MSRPIWSYQHELLSFGYEVGATLAASISATPASLAYPASNDAIFVPVTVKQTVLIKRLYSLNGTSANNNIDVGIYTKGGTRVVSSGSTAQSGTNAPQFYDVTDLTLSPGLYYLAVAMDGTSGTLFRLAPGLHILQLLGVAKQATAFALPATATFATPTANYLPVIGAEITEIK